MSSMSERLKQAIKRRGSVLSFQQEMEERLRGTDVDGYSYPSITKYVKGEVSPRHEFLVHAADVLDVRKPWLFAGEGEMTEAEEVAARYGRDSMDPATKLMQAIRYRFGGFGEDRLGLSEPQQRLFLQLLVRYVQTAPDGDDLLDFEEPSEELLELAGDLHFLIWLPVQGGAWGFETLAYRRQHQLNEYATAVMHALSLWLRGPGQGLPVGSADHSLFRKLRGAATLEEEVREVGATREADLDSD